MSLYLYEIAKSWSDLIYKTSECTIGISKERANRLHLQEAMIFRTKIDKANSIAEKLKHNLWYIL